MKFYEKELNLLVKSNRFRKRKIFDENIIDMASNDYLGLAKKKSLLEKAYQRLSKEKYHSSKASMLVNGYHLLHKKFEKKLMKLNNFEDCITVGSGFLANIALIESLVRKKDILFIDEQYHASGILATKLIQGKVVFFKHNNYEDLENKIKEYLDNKNIRMIIAIEGVYSMSATIAPKEFAILSTKYNTILLVDEAHSSGVIGKNLLGWYDYWDIKIEPNYIKMGTLGKAYGSFGAYILASSHIVSYLENRAKSIIYTTSLSLFDTSLAFENLKYIQKNKNKIKNKIQSYQKIVYDILGIKVDSLIVTIEIDDNKKVLIIQKELQSLGYIVGAIRQPTVKKAIIRMIIKLDITKKQLINICQIIKNRI